MSGRGNDDEQWNWNPASPPAEQQWDWGQGPPQAEQHWQFVTKEHLQYPTQHPDPGQTAPPTVEPQAPGGGPPPPGYGPAAPPGVPGGPRPGQGGPAPQQTGGPGGPPAPTKKSKRGLVLGLGIGGGAVALGLVLAVVAVLIGVTGGEESGSGPSASASARANQASWTIPPGSSAENTLHSTFLANGGELLVRTTEGGVIAYQMSDGKKKWAVDAPGGSVVCAASRGAPQNVMAVVFGKASGDCSTAVAVDVAAGSQLWSHDFTAAFDDSGSSSAAVSVGHGKVFVSTGSRVIGYDARNGPGSGKPVSKPAAGGGTCSTGDVRAGRTGVLLVQQCIVKESYLLQRLDPETLEGKPAVVKVENSVAPMTIQNVAPPVLHRRHGSGELWFFDDEGEKVQTVSADSSLGRLDLNTSSAYQPNDMHNEVPVAVVGTTLVAHTQPVSDTEPTKVVAFDLRSGTRKWEREITGSSEVGFVRGGEARKVTLLAGAGRVSAAAPSAREEPQVLTLDPAKGGTMAEGDMFESEDLPASISGSFLLAADGDLVAVTEGKPSEVALENGATLAAGFTGS